MYEDNHLLIVNKPAGIPSQDDPSEDPSIFSMAKNYVKAVYQKPGNVYMALLHRLDRPVSGLLVLAKTGKSAARMSQFFKDHEVDKTYLAIVEKRPSKESGELIHYLLKNSNTNTVKAFNNEVKYAKKAVLKFELIATNKTHSLLKVKPETGRSHQIRAQLAKFGCTIAGDKKYGSAKAFPDKSIGLLAWQLKFKHPVTGKKNIDIKLPLPDMDIWKNFAGIVG